MQKIIFVGVAMVALFALPGVQANEQGCAVDIGAPAIGFQGPVTIGGCTIGTIGTESATVGETFVSDEENCFLRADTDGTPPVDVNVEPGTTLKAGDVVWLFCDLGVDNFGTVSLSAGDWA